VTLSEQDYCRQIGFRCDAKAQQVEHEQESLTVESRSGAVARRLRFQIPLIKPDVRISRISAFGQGCLCFRPRQSCAEAFQVE
jgi:hypothetical protein